MSRRIASASNQASMILLATTLLSGAFAPARSDTVRVEDATGREVAVSDVSRIVSIGGSTTEILYALGLESRVVGVDVTSLYPPRALAEKPSVGYMRALSPEGVLGLNPSLILAIEGAGPKDILGVLQAASVPFVLIPDPYSGDGIVEKVRLIAKVTGTERRGRCLAEAVRADLDAVAELRKRIDRPIRALFVLSFLNGKAMVAGAKTAADGIITLGGAVNAITGFEGYKPVSDEAIIAAAPDVVLAMKRDSHPMTAEMAFDHPGFRLTPAAERQAFVAMDGLYLLGFGPRTASAARELIGTFYPHLKPSVSTTDGSSVGASPAHACQE